MTLNTVTYIITEGQFEKLSGIAEMSMFFFRFNSVIWHVPLLHTALPSTMRQPVPCTSLNETCKNPHNITEGHCQVAEILTF